MNIQMIYQHKTYVVDPLPSSLPQLDIEPGGRQDPAFGTLGVSPWLIAGAIIASLLHHPVQGCSQLMNFITL